MKLYAIKIVLYLSIICSIVLCANFFNKKDHSYSTYSEAIIDKHELAKGISKPKLILAGGSNVAFGFNSKDINNEFQIPIVNLGLHAGLGLDFILDELKIIAKPKDIIIISPEYFLNIEGNYRFKKYVCDFYPEAKNFIETDIVNEVTVRIENSRNIYKKLLNIDPVNTQSEVYTRNGFNAYGDLISHINKKSREKLKDRSYLKKHKWEGIVYLNKLQEYCNSKNITMLFSYPPYPKSEYIKNSSAIKSYNKQLQSSLNIELLSNPEEFVFQDHFFFDTIYHLNGNGRELRTQKTISLLTKNKTFLTWLNKYRCYSIPLNL